MIDYLRHTDYSGGSIGHWLRRIEKLALFSKRTKDYKKSLKAERLIREAVQKMKVSPV